MKGGRRRRVKNPPHTGQADCRCPSCRARRTWAEGKWANRRWPPRAAWDAWTAQHDAALAELAKTCSPTEISVLLEERFGIPRTKNAVVLRLRRLHLGPATQAFGVAQVAEIFGVSEEVVRRTWIARGWLVARQMSARPCSRWLVAPGELETFIRKYPDAYDWQAMRPGRWRSLAEVEWRRDPLYSIAEAARFLGVHPETVRRRACRGSLPGLRRVKRGGAHGPLWQFRRSALLACEHGKPHLAGAARPRG